MNESAINVFHYLLFFAICFYCDVIKSHTYGYIYIINVSNGRKKYIVYMYIIILYSIIVYEISARKYCNLKRANYKNMYYIYI